MLYVAAMQTPSSLAWAFLLSASAVVACSSSSQNAAGGSGGTATTSSATTGTSTSSATGTGAAGGTSSSSTTTTTGTGGTGGTGGSGGQFTAEACEKAGGVCVSQGTCAQFGGQVPSSSPDGCHFDDGAAECCVPPSAKPSPTDCVEAGGLCSPVGGCLDAGGYITSNNGGCVSTTELVCCVPHKACGDQTIECCTDSTIFNPSCDNGMFVCQEGSPVPKGTCMVP